MACARATHQHAVCRGRRPLPASSSRAAPTPSKRRHTFSISPSAATSRLSSSDRCATRARSATKAPPTCSKASASPPSPQSRGKGVLVVLNDEINAAREVTKTDALRLQTFQTRGYGVLGVVDSDRVVYYRERHQAPHESSPSSTSPRFSRCRAWTSSWSTRARPATSSRRWSTQGAKGIVVASAGAGATSGTQGEGIRYAIDKGVFVVTSTRAGRRTHRVATVHGDSRRHIERRTRRRRSRQVDHASGLPPRTCAPLKARILLMLALTATKDEAEIQRMFTEY